MHYIIYPDTLFLENFICNLLFLWFLKTFLFPTARGGRLLLTACLTALCNTLASILFFHHIWILRIGVLFPAAGLMTCCFMGIREGRRLMYLLYQMTLWTLVLGGSIQVLQQFHSTPEAALILWILLFIMIFGILEKIFRKYRRQKDCIREVVLYRNGNCCHMQGFLDTGNHLIDPVNHQPVSIVAEECWKNFIKEQEPPNYCLIPCKTVGDSRELLPGTRIDYMVIMDNEESRIITKPMIAITKQPFTGIFHYSILLHSDYC